VNLDNSLYRLFDGQKGKMPHIALTLMKKYNEFIFSENEFIKTLLNILCKQEYISV